MAERPYPETSRCGLCTHAVNDHNMEHGCEKCDCMATRGEANTPRHTPGAPVYYPKRVFEPVEKPKRIINPYRVMFAPGDQENVSNAEFVGHQYGSMERWNGYATADEARAEAQRLRDRGGDINPHWIAVEIREL